MEKATVSKTFSPKKYKDEELTRKANNVLTRMTNNEIFPDPIPPLSVLKINIDNYAESLIKSQNRRLEDTAKKRQNRKVLEATLNHLAEYVQLISNGNALSILSGGFDINRKPALVGPLAKAEKLIVKPGDNVGSVKLSCNIVSHAKMYMFEYCLAPETAESVWIPVLSSKRKTMIDKLQRGKKYAFRVAAVGTDPSLSWSNVVTSYVI